MSTQSHQYNKRRDVGNRLGNAMKTACYLTPYLPLYLLILSMANGREYKVTTYLQGR